MTNEERIKKNREIMQVADDVTQLLMLMTPDSNVGMCAALYVAISIMLTAEPPYPDEEIMTMCKAGIADVKLLIERAKKQRVEATDLKAVVPEMVEDSLTKNEQIEMLNKMMGMV